MLAHLLIKNYALIQELEMPLSPHLNMITGETGAGKSIMLGAVGLLLGNRSDSKVLFKENEKCIVEGEFDIKEYHLEELFNDLELDYEKSCIIRREISAGGKSRAFINDTPVTLDVLKKIATRLIDVHSQHDTLLLASNAFQLEFIDGFAQNRSLKKAYQEAYREFKMAQKNYDELLDQQQALKKEFDFNQFLFRELQQATLQLDEQEQAEAELNVLEHAEEVTLHIHAALEQLSEGDYAVHVLLKNILHELALVAKYAPTYQALLNRVESCVVELKDIADELDKEKDTISLDKEKIQLLHDRLSLIYTLQKKHQASTIQELLSIQSALEEKVKKVVNSDEELSQAKNNLESTIHDLEEKANQLTQSRKVVFLEMEKRLKNLLHDLGMPHAVFTIHHHVLSDFQLTGKDDISFLFSANKGVAPQELKNAASGGEFSRLMLALKYVLAHKTALPTIIFDEIDTGVSGEIALKMATMMQEMSKYHQVVTITHLPQLAAKGDTHFFVYKDEQSIQAVSKLKKLSEKERVVEVAKMIGGENPSEKALSSAKELLEK